MTSLDSRRTTLVRQALILDSSNLSRRVVSGASFTFLGIALRTILTIGSMSVLARLLRPEDFGYIAMATVVTELAGLLGSFGFASILIQRHRITRLQLDTVFWASFAVGLISATTVFLLSFLTTWIFSDPKIGELLRFLCLTFVFGSLTAVHESVLSRLMRFRTEFFIQFLAIAVRASSAIVFALSGHGVWSLVAGSLIGSVTTMTLLLVLIPYMPRRKFHASYLLNSWRTSGSYMGNTILYYINMNVDLLLIGRQLGPTSLGYYQNARSLTDEVRGRIAMPLQRVLFPAFSALQSDKSRLQSSALRAARLLAAVIFPIGIGLSAVANELVPLLYGHQWLAMIPVLSMLGISAAIRGSTAIASPLFNSQNKVTVAFRYNIIGTVILVTTVLIALPYGLEIVALTIAANSIFSLISFYVAFSLIGTGLNALVEVLARPIMASLAMWIVIDSTRSAISPYGLGLATTLIFFVGLGVMTYSSFLHILSRSYMNEFKDLALRVLGRKG